MKLNIKMRHVCILLICILVLFLVFALKKTYLRENIENITQEEPGVSINVSGVNNVVDLVDSTKSKNNMNVDYHNVIEQSENNYQDGNTLINTYSKMYPLRKEEAQLDNTIDTYKKTTGETNDLNEQIKKMDKQIDSIQLNLKNYNQIELELQEAVAKKASLENDIRNILSKTAYCNREKTNNNSQIQDLENEITSFKEKLKEKREIFQTTYNKERSLANQFGELQNRLRYLNNQPCKQ